MNTMDLCLIKAAGYDLQLFLNTLKSLSAVSVVGALFERCRGMPRAACAEVLVVPVKQRRLIFMGQVQLGRGFCGYAKYFPINSKW